MAQQSFSKITPLELSQFVAGRSKAQLEAYGPIEELFKLVSCSPSMGISQNPEDLKQRIAHFGQNRIRTPPPKLLIILIWEALHDKTLIMLIVAALISLSIGIYRMIFVKDSSSYEWLEGTAILIAVFMVIIVSSLNDWFKEKKFRALNTKNENRQIHVLRSSKEQMISIFDILVGDIILLETGDIIPADGILFESHSLVIDESSITGESKPIQKTPNGDCILLSGTIVNEGIGKLLVMAVGPYSCHGKLMESMNNEQCVQSITPLQRQLFYLAERIAYFGIAAALLLFGSLLIKLFVFEKNSPSSFSDIFMTITNIFIQGVTILVVAVPEGLPMAVTLTLAFASTRMTAENNLVRILSACETMGSATSICTDKTGTLTTNNMAVVGGLIFGRPFGALEEESEEIVEDGFERRTDIFKAYKTNLFLPLESIIETDMEARDLLLDSIIFNSTAIVPETNSLEETNNIIGSKTEVALLQMLQKLNISDPCKLREQKGRVLSHMVPFSSERKMMKVVIDQSELGKPPLILVKGAPEIILASCSTILQFTEGEGLVKVPINETAIKTIQWRLARMGLRTLAFAYYLPETLYGDEDAIDRTYIGMVGIEDPLRDDVPEAVASCQRAGISIRMVTGDSLETASCIAKRAGILMRGGLAMEGSRFRSLDDYTLTKIVPRLQVLARSSPIDKQILVNKLKSLGDVVAVTGDGTNDGPALRAAHVGFSMGITGTEVAKEASSIILMDDKFSSIVKAVGWGRCVGDAVRKFLLFQLTVNISAVVVAFISALLDAKGHGIFNALQLLWVNLLMDTLGALALATDRPTPDLLDRKPEGLDRRLVTKGMWTRIIGMALFQICFLLAMIKFLSSSHKTFIFNSFVMMQLWNEMLCHTLPPLPGAPRSAMKFWFNPFKNLLSNHIFILVIFISALGQFMIIQFGGAIFDTTPLSGWEWLNSIAIGALSIPLFFVLNALCSYIARKEQAENENRSSANATMASRERLQWHATISDIQHGLSVFAVLRRARPVLSD